MAPKIVYAAISGGCFLQQRITTIHSLFGTLTFVLTSEVSDNAMMGFLVLVVA